MHTLTSSVRPRKICAAFALAFLLIASLCLPAWSAEEGKPVAAPKTGRTSDADENASPNKSSESILKLSPFVVHSQKDRGYLAENTLSATRLNTPTKYIGTAVTEITQAEIHDIAQFSTEDLIDFTPNGGTYGSKGTLSSDTFLVGAESGPRFNIRGFAVASAARDFILVRVADDAYDLDRISVDRGPNSVLFGMGDPGGIVNAVSTQATMKDSFQVATRFDNWGSHRETFRLHRQLIPGKLAIFLAGLDEDKLTNRKPSDWRTQRSAGALTFQPFTTTAIKASFERGNIDDIIVPPWPASDGLSPWIAAGEQEIPTGALNGGVYGATSMTRPPAADQAALKGALSAAGYQLSLRSAFTLPMLVFNGVGGSMPPIDDLAYVQTADAFAGAGRIGNPTLVDSPLPYRANPTGYGSRRVQHFQNYTVSVEQQVTPNMFIKALFNRQNTNLIIDRSTYVQFDTLYLDKNPTLATIYGTSVPNPNYNRYFNMAQGAAGIVQGIDDDTMQLEGAYKFDFRDHVQGFWGRLLGHHNIGVLRQRVSSDVLQQVAGLVNLSPQKLLGVTPQLTPAAAANMLSGANFPVIAIHYIDPAVPSSWATPDLASMYGGISNPLFAGDAVPSPDPSGVTPRWLAIGSSRNLLINNTQSAVVQSFFWDNRIVTTFGWRKDVADTRNLPNAYVPYNGEVNWTDNVGKVDPYKGNSLHHVTYYEQIGKTQTQSVVVYPVRALGLFFNQSQNYQPVGGGGALDIFGVPLQPSHARGRDWGVKLSLLGDRVSATLDRFTIRQVDAPTSVYRAGYGGSFAQGLQNPLNAIGNTMFLLTNDPAFRTYPFPTTLPWYSTNDVWAKGYELSLTTNLTPNWRLTANFSKQTSVASNYGATEQRWYDYALAFVTKKYPQYLNSDPISLGARGVPETIAEDFKDAADVLAQAQTLAGRTDARQAEYGGNLVTAYDFTNGWLKGLGVGGTYKWRSDEAIGYALQPGSKTLFDASKPYFGPRRCPVSLFAYYRFDLPHNIRAKVQINADNINMNQKLYPFTEADSGNGTPVVVKYAVGEGTTFAISTTFDF